LDVNVLEVRVDPESKWTEALQTLQIYAVIHVASIGTAAVILERPQRPELFEVIGHRVGR
jgi:hypothetical protein